MSAAALPDGVPPHAAGGVSGLPPLQALVSYLAHEPLPAIVLDPDYRILAANPAYERMYGVDDRGVIGQTCFQVSHHATVPCDQAGEHCPMRKAFETRAPDRVLHIHHTPQGPEHVDVELRPLVDGAGEVVGYVERLHTVRSASARPQAVGLVGRSAPFMAALAAVRRVAASPLPVLLLGESGTGKELFARAVHEASPRAGGPLVVVEGSGLTETLFESELFGYEKGAFTGAVGRKPGLVETAQGGTLFLDEIGDVPLSMQVKLLRLIETGTYRRVGGVETRQADFRLVAATHQPLLRRVAEGRFRQDLYYRIGVFPIVMPPVRDGRVGIPLLVASFLRRSGARDAPRVDAAAMARLQQHDWPGNLRELRNALEWARLFAQDGVIRTEDLPASVLAGPQPDAGSPEVPVPCGDGDGDVDAWDEETWRAVVRGWKGTRRALAQRLGLSERTLYRRLQAMGLR